MKLLFSLMSLISAFFSGIFILYPWREIFHRLEISRLEKVRDKAAKEFKTNSSTGDQAIIVAHNLERKSQGLSPIKLKPGQLLDNSNIMFESYNEIIDKIKQHYNDHESRDFRSGTVVLLLAMLIFGCAALLIG